MSFRKFIVALVVPALCILPARRADAFVAPLAVPYLVTSSGATAMTVASAAALAAGGAALLGVLFKDSSGNDVLDVKLNPKAPERVPAGWTAAPSSGDAPVPPATSNGTVTGCTWFNGSLTGRNDGAEPGGGTACVAALIAVWNAAPCLVSGGRSVTMGLGAVNTSSNTVVVTRVDCNTGAAMSDISASYTDGCPVGYSLSGGSCVLTSAPSVPFPADNIGRKDCSTGTCGDNTRDPDNTAPAGVTTGGSQITVKSGTSTTTITINGDGSITVKTVKPNGDGTSTATSVKASAPNPAAPDGGTNATGVTQTQQQGEGDLTTETPPANCAGGPCATEATQLQVKEALSTAGVTADQKALTAEKAALDTATTARTDAMSSAASVTSLGLGLSITWPTSGSCANPAFAMPHGHGTLSIDLCGKRAQVQQIMAWIVAIVTAWALFTIGAGAVRRD